MESGKMDVIGLMRPVFGDQIMGWVERKKYVS